VKTKNLSDRNFLRLGGIFRAGYAYVDLLDNDHYVADSLFFRRKIPVKFGDEMAKDGDKYRLVFCKIRRKDIESFEEALAEIRNKMSLLGHNDYDDYCRQLMAVLEKA